MGAEEWPPVHTSDFSPAHDCLSLVTSLPSGKHMIGKGSFSSPSFSLLSGISLCQALWLASSGFK